MIVGVDYSMSCPCLCIMNWDGGCVWRFLTGEKRFVLNTGVFHSREHEDYRCNEERWNNIASWALGEIPVEADVFIEGYSFGSRQGQAFSVGELTHCLKHGLWERGQKFTLIPGPVMKKFATGSGNADKVKIYRSFNEQTGIDLLKVFDRASWANNPMSDIADSYFLAKMGLSILQGSYQLLSNARE